jgi:hypothetical protein
LDTKNKDSIAPYPYTFPFLGKKPHRKDSTFLFLQELWSIHSYGNSDITISDLQLGFQNANHNIPLTPVDLIKFGTSTATIKNINLRPDLWVLPFLDVYGIIGYTEGRTSVSIVEPVEFNAAADLKGYTYGFGTTVAGGVGKYFIVGDFNWQWSAMDILDKPAASSITSFRFGRTFPLTADKSKKFWLLGWPDEVQVVQRHSRSGENLGMSYRTRIFRTQRQVCCMIIIIGYNSLGNTPADIAKKQTQIKF